MKKPTRTAAERKAGAPRRTGAKAGKAESFGTGEPEVRTRIRGPNKPFADRFAQGRVSTGGVLGENVKRLRTRLELSQADLARAIGTDQSAIALIETKRANPTVLTIEKLAAVLKTTVVDLLSKPGRDRKGRH